MIKQHTPAFRRATLALSLGSIMIFSNLYLTQPLLPLLAKQYQLSNLEASWSVTITTFTLALSLLLYGSLSDALGRKRLMVYSMLGIFFTTASLSFITDYQQLLWLRGLQGCFLAGLPAIAIAYMGDEFSRPAMLTAVGYYIAANTIGGISGRLFAGLFGEWLGTSGIFLFMALFSLVTLLIFWKTLPASKHFETRSMHLMHMLQALVLHLRNPVLMLAYLVGSLNFMIFMNQYSYITFVLADTPYSLSSFWIGLLFLTYLSGTFASAVSGRLAARFSQSTGMAAGIILFAIGSLVTLAQPLWVLISGFLINAFGFFLCHSLASSWVSHRAKQNRATASALYLVFYYLGGSVGGFYLYPFWISQHWTGIVIGSILVLIITLLMSLRMARYE